MTETNGRLKIPWVVALHFATTLVAAGIIIGKLGAVERRVDALALSVPSVATLMVMKNDADTEHIRLRHEDERLWEEVHKLDYLRYPRSAR